MDPASVQPGTLAHMQRQVRAAVEQQGPAGAQAEVAAALDARLDLPPHHRDATTAADAYRWALGGPVVLSCHQLQRQ